MAQPGSFGFSFSGGKGSAGLAGFPDTNAMYKTAPKRRKSSHESAAHKVGGLLGAALKLDINLVNDIKDATLGLPMGLVQTFKDPIGTLKLTAGSTWHTWSPLFKGDIGTFGHQFYDHPLAPLLDIASVLTGGAALAAKGGGLAASAGLISKTSKFADLRAAAGADKLTYGQYKLNPDTMKHERVAGVPEYTKATSLNPLIRKIQIEKDSLYNSLAGENPRWKFSPDTPLIGANRRYRRRELTKTWHKHAAMMTQMASMVQAGKDLAAKGPAADAARANIFTTVHANMLRHAEKIKPTEDVSGPYTYVRDHQHIGFLKNGKVTADTFEAQLGKINTSFTTRNASEAARGADGSLLIAPKHTKEMLGLMEKEGVASSRALKYLYHKPTMVWKYAVLALRPAFFVNNAVGNYFMYTMAHGGSHAMRGYVDALRQVHGDFHVARELGKTERWYKKMTDPNGSGWMERNFLDQLTNSFADSSYGLEGKVAAAKVAGSKLRYGLYPITHAVSDRFLRRAAINSMMRGSKDVKRFMDEGYTFDQAATRALAESPDLRNRISEKTNDTLGDYHTLSKAEQHIRNVVPFYTWDRAIVRHGGKLLIERPWVVAGLANIGQQGVAGTEEALGVIPSFLKGAVPLGKGSDKGRRPILTTTGLNPYASIAEVAGIANMVATGQGADAPTLMGAINPIAAGAASWVAGQNLSTGGTIDRTSGLPAVFDIARSQFQALPQTRMAAAGLPEQGFGWDKIRKLIGEKPKSYYTRKGSNKHIPAMYSKDFEEIALAYLGAPIKQLSPSAAKKRRGEEKKKELTF